MKYLVVLFLFAATLISAQTLLLEENFNYDIGSLVPDNNWVTHSGTEGQIQVVSGSLSFNDYASSALHNSIEFGTTSNSEDIRRTFDVQSNTVYCSFLINFSESTGASDGAYFFGFAQSSSSTYIGRIFTKKDDSDASKIKFGLSNRTSTTTDWTESIYSTNTTYLLVLKYQVNSGSTSDDNIKLYIFSSGDSFAEEPVTTTLTASDLSTDKSIGAIQVRESGDAYNAKIDGIRVSTSWNQTPLPVELVTFTATNADGNIKLNWQTATEVNNYGFDIQRSVDQSEFETIGFVEGHGNSNSPKEYEFVDSNPPSGNLEYRLKQIDTDGSFEYFSLTAKVENQVTDVNDDLLPKKFELSQNFPNPFNPTTLIKYEIPGNGNVGLKVYDMLGKEVATVVNEIQNAGVHYVHFDASKLSSGIYIYALKFGTYYKAKKLTLIY